MWFAAGGIALAAVILVVGLLLTGGSDEPNPGPGRGSGPTAGTGSTAPPPPIEAANASAIKIRDAGEAVPYPSAIDVSDAAGVVVDVDVTLHGFSHTYPDDVGVVLVGPGGESVLLMSDVGGNNDHAVSGLDLTFDDEAGRGLSDKASLRAGTFLPTTGSDKGGGNCCGFTGRNPAPRPPYGRALSVFDGTDPTGTWDLYVADDSGGDQGRITGGWSLEIELGSGPVTPSPSASASTGSTGPTGATAASGATGAAAIFRDDFSDPSSGWDVFQDPKTSASYQDGRYVVTAAGGFRVSGDINTSTQQLSELGDVRVEVTGQLLSGPSALYGVICRAVSPTDYYYFLVQGNGDYYIGESAADRASNFDTGFSPSIATGLASNRIAAECTDGPSGVSLRLSVNGVAVNTVIDSEHPLGPGGTGVRVESRRDDMAAAFDDYVVSAPAGA